MNYYAHVHFSKQERDQQRSFLQLMNSIEVIQVSQEEIDDWYKEDVERDLPGYNNHLVLHGDEEKDRFRYSMDAFFPLKEYQITDEPGSKEFKEWLEKKDAQKTSP